MVDIDYFKSVNDTFGHEFGDVVLQELQYCSSYLQGGLDV
jgi:diguanylate cyclase (GGDEF)-like protein